MSLVIVYFLSFMGLLGGIIYELNKYRGYMPKYLFVIGMIALIPWLNTFILVGIAIAAITKRIK